MQRFKPLPPQARLCALLVYNRTTGGLHWRAGRRTGGPAGKAYRFHDGPRRRITIDGQSYFTSRIIWKMVRGCDPDGEVDHRDTDKLNERFKNLRDTTSQQNKANAGLRRDNTSGFKGVQRNGSRAKPWHAGIMVNKHTIPLGDFTTAQLAADAYDVAAIKYFGPFALTNAMIRAASVVQLPPALAQPDQAAAVT